MGRLQRRRVVGGAGKILQEHQFDSAGGTSGTPHFHTGQRGAWGQQGAAGELVRRPWLLEVGGGGGGVSGSCGPGADGTEIAVEFDVGDGLEGEAKIITICHHLASSSTLWARHSLWDEVGSSHFAVNSFVRLLSLTKVVRGQSSRKTHFMTMM